MLYGVLWIPWGLLELSKGMADSTTNDENYFIEVIIEFK